MEIRAAIQCKVLLSIQRKFSGDYFTGHPLKMLVQTFIRIFYNFLYFRIRKHLHIIVNCFFAIIIAKP